MTQQISDTEQEQAAHIWRRARGITQPLGDVLSNPTFQAFLANGRGNSGSCPGFDAEYYARQIEGALGALSPIVHYLRFGGKLGLAPHPVWDAHYLAPALVGSDVPPLYWVMMTQPIISPVPLLDPNTAFDGDISAAQHPYARLVDPDYKDTIDTPLSPYVDPSWYTLKRGGGVDSVQAFAADYYATDPRERLSPHPLFDGTWYRHTYNLAAGRDAFEHFLTHGVVAGNMPNVYAKDHIDCGDIGDYLARGPR